MEPFINLVSIFGPYLFFFTEKRFPFLKGRFYRRASLSSSVGFLLAAALYHFFDIRVVIFSRGGDLDDQLPMLLLGSPLFFTLFVLSFWKEALNKIKSAFQK